ncbi:TnsD family Tn7-like transposition protein [Pseudoalteromonas sp. bablab_jr011]|uniref:TnsD family Tn7-like transposition protein n=1 Tax=Pseudoalteromonas sp. bablab_jr011 TaxID=2755062 RepID=UPI0018F78305|nr:TnsD family Tn7-like transposition protein [Pseudoalteromonas sp. bablab_jr011]
MMRMKQIYPRIYDGETIYSIASRLVLSDVSSSISQSMLNVFENKNIQLDSILPSFINRLALVSGCSRDELLDKHSLFQYYALFSTESVRAQARALLLKDNSIEAFKTLGLLANRISCHDVHQFCPVCAQEQEKQFGEAYWLRAHQLPLTNSCYKHHCRLVSIPKQRKRLLFPLIDYEPSFVISTLEHKLTSFNYAFSQAHYFDPARLRQAYAVRLINQGLATTRFVRHSLWREQMRVYFDEYMSHDAVFKLLQNDAEYAFPASIFYNDEAIHHPLKHLLVCTFLFEHVDDFIDAYTQKELLKVVHSEPITPQSEIDALRQDTVLTLLRQGLPLRQIIQVANVSAATVRNIARKHAIPLKTQERKINDEVHRAITIQLIIGRHVADIANKFNLKKGDVEQVLSGQPIIKELRRRIRFYRHRQQARRALIATLYTLKTPTITLLRRSADKEYVWLFKHDKPWLNSFKKFYFKSG